MKALLKRVIVTGAAGFVGRHLCEQLAASGCVVVGIVRRDPGPANSAWSRHVDLWLGGDQAFLPARLEDFAPDCIFNLASLSQVTQAQRDPSAAYEANTASVWQLLEAVRKLSVTPVVVHASSVAVYGSRSSQPMTEDSPLFPQGAYAASKAASEIIARSFGESYAIPLVIARLGNVYGRDDPHEARLIPYLLRQFSAGRSPHLREGGSRRGYVHVQDVVKALIALARHGHTDGVHGETFNVGSDRLHSNRDVAELMRQLFERYDIDICIDADGEKSAQSISIAKISARIGWSPRIPLAEGLRDLIEQGVLSPCA